MYFMLFTINRLFNILLIILFRYLSAWSNFVKAAQLCLQRNMTEDDLNTIRNLLLDFYIHYDK